MIQSLKNGCGVGFSLYQDEKTIDFKLAIFLNKRWSTEELEYGFISNDNKYASSNYSGGVTGMGNDRIVDLPDHLQIIETNLTKIIEMAKEEDIKLAKSIAEENQKKYERVERLNKLPTTFEIGDRELDELFCFTRIGATFNPSYSHNIRVFVTLQLKNGGWVNNYQTKNGSLQVQKFAYDYPTISNPKLALLKLVERKKEIEQLIESV